MARREVADRHAEDRARQRRKARLGMRVTGRSVRLLAELAGDPGRRRVPGKSKRAKEL